MTWLRTCLGGTGVPEAVFYPRFLSAAHSARSRDRHSSMFNCESRNQESVTVPELPSPNFRLIQWLSPDCSQTAHLA